MPNPRFVVLPASLPRRLLAAFAALCVGAALTVPARAQDTLSTGLILNEWNAVAGDSVLVEGDPLLGVVEGNGGDWFEMVVVTENLDARGWQLVISEEENDGTRSETVLTLSDHALLSDLRAGTILTVIEDPIISETGEVFAEDAVYDPRSDDWSLTFQAGSHGSGLFISAEKFPVSNSAWQLEVRDSTGATRYGPAGEGAGTLEGGVGSSEIGELEQDPAETLEAATAAYGDGDGSTFAAPNMFAERLQDFGALRASIDDITLCDGKFITVDLAAGDVPTDGDDVIRGTSGADEILAGEGNDTICSGDGDDTVYGQGGDDVIIGGAGNDRLRGGDGEDYVDGGVGIDNVAGGRGSDIVFGGDGADEVVRGNVDDDVVDGGPGDDLLVAGNGGRDFVSGGIGADKVTGGPRPDVVNGGPGADEVKGNGGADAVHGGADDDDVLGGPQPDYVSGDGGFDTCSGGTTGGDALENDVSDLCESETAFP